MVVESRCVRAAGALVELAWLAQAGRQAGSRWRGSRWARAATALPCRLADALRCSALLCAACQALPARRTSHTGAAHTAAVRHASHTVPPGRNARMQPAGWGAQCGCRPAAACQPRAAHWLAGGCPAACVGARVRACVPAAHGTARSKQAGPSRLRLPVPCSAQARQAQVQCLSCLLVAAGRAAGLPPVCARRRSSKRNAPACAAPRAPVGSGCRAHAAAARCVLRAAPLVCVPAAASHTAPPACPATTPPPPRTGMRSTSRARATLRRAASIGPALPC